MSTDVDDCTDHGIGSVMTSLPTPAAPENDPTRQSTNKRDDDMNKDRIAGVAKQAEGAVKETAGKIVGDAKLTADGKSDKAEGKIQNAVGGLKDALKG
jgi:uncharacterized protein YjbJ (UPF0337 family)